MALTKVLCVKVYVGAELLNVERVKHLKEVATHVTQDVVSDAAPARTSNFQTKYTTKRDGAWKSPNQLRLEREAMPGYGVEGPPSILNPYKPPRTHRMRGMNYKGGGIAKRGTGAAYKSGGRVTGIAKRGFGRALMKGKN